MRTTLKHVLHEHTLILRKFSQAIPYRCSLCAQRYHEPAKPLSGEIYNQVYSCEDCNFFIHKWCAESPQQIQHPCHPQHPLSLRITNLNFDYRCGELKCHYKGLHAVSAIATLPPEDEDKNRDAYQELDFFGHHHPLNFFQVKIPTSTRIYCQVCNDEILACSVYGCRACFFFIHESCAQLPRQIESHPLHPEHLLNLVGGGGQEDTECILCDRQGRYMYICYECDTEFGLHVNCAVASSTPPSDLAKLDHPSHAHHKLISGYLKGGHNDVKCEICSCLIKSGEVYCCTREDDSEQYYSWFCSFFIHKTCAELPRKLQHPLCPALTLDTDNSMCGRKCAACGDMIEGIHYYKSYDGFHLYARCEVETLSAVLEGDDFHMHARCAVETLSAILKGGATPKIQHFADDNLFFTCYVPKLQDGKKEDTCVACQKSIEGLGYYCLKRNEYIHKSCAEELKPALEHPLHPQHPLLLQSSNGIFFCKGCNSTCEANNDRRSYYYSCSTCEFHLDLQCALPKLTLKDPCHQHDLVYFEHVKYVRCHACGYCCSNDLYRCVECNFNVHLDCLPLPSVVEDTECHLHPLTLCDKVPDQDCGVCRLGTNARHGAYYCEECNFVAHIHCAVSKGVKPKHSQSLEKEIDRAREKIDNTKRSLEYYQKEMQERMATLNALESMKSGWGET